MPNPIAHLSLNVKQLFELVMQLSKKQKRELADLLLGEDITISGEQKKIVRDRIKKYKAQPRKLISEGNAWNMINTDCVGSADTITSPSTP